MERLKTELKKVNLSGLTTTEISSLYNIENFLEKYQLLDKSNYPATQTINGVTFTNNDDGTITVNGTATSTAFFLLFKYSDNLIPGHKYLLSGSPNDASDNAYIQCYDDTNFEWLTDKGGGSIAIFPKQVINPSGATNIRIRIASGYIGNNLVFKPQLFDLTEMYGAGNEPTTVNDVFSKSNFLFNCNYENLENNELIYDESLGIFRTEEISDNKFILHSISYEDKISGLLEYEIHRINSFIKKASSELNHTNNNEFCDGSS